MYFDGVIVKTTFGHVYQLLNCHCLWVFFASFGKKQRTLPHHVEVEFFLHVLYMEWLYSCCVLNFCYSWWDSVHSKRTRRGPIIEADGMLKMFHCPYEGCSQVYVAISSFQVINFNWSLICLVVWKISIFPIPFFHQNHINLVHRKGKTKVCPHPGCGKKFYLSNHLHRHMIIHSGDLASTQLSSHLLCVMVSLSMEMFSF